MTLAYIGMACLAASVVLLSLTVLHNSMQVNKAKVRLDVLDGIAKMNAKKSHGDYIELDTRMSVMGHRVSELERKVRGDSDR